MDYFSLISQRESCRNYDPNRPVSHQQLTRCLEAARIAPSACNSPALEVSWWSTSRSSRPK